MVHVRPTSATGGTLGLGSGIEQRAATTSALLGRILELSPVAFEGLVGRLLYRLGYGNPETGTLTVTQASHDEGIDVVCSRDALGAEKIVVQVKRWSPGNNVHRDAIQKLEGARSARRANYAIFITTSGFSPWAQEEAKRASIELIDGKRLTEICLEHHVGVEAHAIAVPRIDEDFFESLE